MISISYSNYDFMKNNNITFIVPVHVDSIERLENFITSIGLLLSYNLGDVVVLETSKYRNNFIPKYFADKIDYHHLASRDNIYYKTFLVNYLARNIKTKYLCIWDVDIIIKSNLLNKAINLLTDENYDFVLPYNGTCYNVCGILRECFIGNKDIRFLYRNIPKMNLLYNKSLVGGVVFLNTLKFHEVGLDNEYIYGWGPEDFERYERCKKLNLKIELVDGEIFHLDHPRKFVSVMQKEASVIYDQTLNSSKDEVLFQIQQVAENV